MTQGQLTEQARTLLPEVRGSRLTSVQFVLNYLILSFDAKGALTTLVWPEIAGMEGTVTYGMPGYRDALCGLIEKVVEDVDVGDDETLIFGLEGDNRIIIRLQTYQQRGDRAIFTTPKHDLLVW